MGSASPMQIVCAAKDLCPYVAIGRQRRRSRGSSWQQGEVSSHHLSDPSLALLGKPENFFLSRSGCVVG